MLARAELRRYLSAVLCSDEVPQTKDCETGPIWTNCDGTSIGADDSPIYEIGEDGPVGEPDLKPGDAHIIYRVVSEKGKLHSRQECSTTLTIAIDLHACENSGWRREDMLDALQERILYRLYASPKVTDSDGNVYRSPFDVARGNEIEMTVMDSDGSFFEGLYASRTIEFTITTQNCVGVPNCPAPPICFKDPCFPSLTPPC